MSGKEAGWFKSIWLIFVVVPVFMAVGCANVTYRTTQPAVTAPCGKYTRTIQFSLIEKAPKEGWIVQRIKRKKNWNDCGGLYHPTKNDFWEAWHVTKDARLPDPSSFDPWEFIENPNSKGGWRVVGQARFFPIGPTLPPEFTAIPPGASANGASYESSTRPSIWPAFSLGMLTREVEMEWDCCDRSESHVTKDTHDR